jgi:uncharacterized protein (DUF1800 family)
MRLNRVKFAAFVLGLGLVCNVPHLLAKKKDEAAPSTAEDRRRALHALNRLTFGPRAGDVDQVLAIGVDKWVDLQLHPERIDDGALNARLEPLRTLRMSSREITEDFPDPQEINQVMNGRRPMPSDPARRLIYEVQLARLQDRRDRKEEVNKNAVAAAAVGKADNGPVDMAAMNGTSGEMNSAARNDATTGVQNPPDRENEMASSAGAAKPSADDEEQARRHEEQLYADLDLQQLLNLPPEERFRKILAMPVSGQISFADSMRGGKRQEFLVGLAPRQKETLLAMNNPGGVVTSELAQAKILRAIYSQRQFEEVMTDFWVNHFNIFMDKGLDRLMITSYERDVIRPHALGKFEDLLVATAKSPAMLFYLDNWLSVGPNSAQALGIPPRGRGPYGMRPRPNQGKRPSGLNENYGRELLELHTLSVNGGYSQRDVTEVAKVFTGWTIDKPAFGGGFKFEPRMHETGTKFVLGRKIKDRGEDEGLEVLHRLATSPRTAHFISLKLAQRFVSDDPPPALVDRMAKTFLKKKGDIREVLLTLFHSSEFWDDSTYRSKVKTPFEFVVSAVRATGAEVGDALPLTRQLNNMGMPLYGAQPPTGYSMKAETWVSSSALLNRMNFSLALMNGRIRGVTVDADQLAGGAAGQDAATTLSTLEGCLMAGGVSKQTHDSIAAQIEAPVEGNRQPRRPEVNTMAGLLLGSPEFQRR